MRTTSRVLAAAAAGLIALFVYLLAVNAEPFAVITVTVAMAFTIVLAVWLAVRTDNREIKEKSDVEATCEIGPHKVPKSEIVGWPDRMKGGRTIPVCRDHHAQLLRTPAPK
jgi:hypothetical protein